MRAGGDAQVLVLAPRFPSINQPWMDTYLEQLGKNGIPFSIVSEVWRPGPYHPKVDRLGLRRYVRLVGEDVRTVLWAALGTFRRRPRWALRQWRAVWRALSRETDRRQRFGASLRALRLADIVHSLPQLQVIHSHSLDLGYDVLPVAQQRGLPIVLTFHGLKPLGVPQTPAHRRQALFHQAREILVNTEFARQRATSLGCDGSRVRVLPQGLPLDDFPFVARAAPVGDEPLLLLTVGRFQRDKGQAYAILAIRRLRERGIRVHWHFAGVGEDLPRLQRLAQRLGVDAHVTFHVRLSLEPLRALYQQCHLFVLTSVGSDNASDGVETQGVVLQEAQASGCIPIATRVGGIPECITDGEDGFLIVDRSHRAIADAVAAVLARPDDWPRYQENGRRTVERRFDADVIGRQVAALLLTDRSA